MRHGYTIFVLSLLAFLLALTFLATGCVEADLDDTGDTDCYELGARLGEDCEDLQPYLFGLDEACVLELREGWRDACAPETL